MTCRTSYFHLLLRAKGAWPHGKISTTRSSGGGALRWIYRSLPTPTDYPAAVLKYGMKAPGGVAKFDAKIYHLTAL